MPVQWGKLRSKILMTYLVRSIVPYIRPFSVPAKYIIFIYIKDPATNHFRTLISFHDLLIILTIQKIAISKKSMISNDLDMIVFDGINCVIE